MRKILVFLALFSTPKKVLAWGVAFIAAGVIASAVLTTPQSIDLDGTNDYLSRASDFTGNADGKEFTFSCWFYISETSPVYVYDTERVSVIVSANDLNFLAKNAANTVIFQAETSGANFRYNTFYNLLVSVDLTNSSNRHIYLNDEILSVVWSSYTNDDIDFTVLAHYIGSSDTPSDYFLGRLSHVYLDYTYRDLSVEATRRNWITADLKPAATAVTAALNPIIYFPMTDPDTWGDNSGTGGNMTENGTVIAGGDVSP